MTTQEAITLLKRHNEWRRATETPETKELGEAIDTVVNHFEQATKADSQTECNHWGKITGVVEKGCFTCEYELEMMSNPPCKECIINSEDIAFINWTPKT